MNLHALKGMALSFLHMPFIINGYIRKNQRNEARIRNKDKVVVVFFISNLSMWRYQGLYDEMRKYPRFDIHIVLSPLKCFSVDEIEAGFDGVRKYFNEHNIKYEDFDVANNRGFDVKSLSPDLLFYTQHYYTCMIYKPHRYQNFSKALLGYYPYGLFFSDPQSDFNEDFHNRAWKLFYPSEMHKDQARKYAAIGDRNVVVTGYPNADYYLGESHTGVWKRQDRKKKKVIWAPHFTIGSNGWMNATCFLDISEAMLELAEKYRHDIQFAFKPHPRLLTELYAHPEWGRTKADSYYEEWEKRSNCQLEKGSYIELFKQSDAMIHDSGSFTIEYHYTQNPVMYTCCDIERFKLSLSEIDRKAIEAHYIGKNTEDIQNFLDNVVLGDQDSMKSLRHEFVNIYLMPPNGKSVAKNTMDEILRCLMK